jgi:ribosomal protein L11 methyltransferase
LGNNKLAWLQLELRVPHALAETLETQLEGDGAVSVSLMDGGDEPMFETETERGKLWQAVLITALFPEDTDKATLMGTYQAYHPTLQDIAEQQWELAWLDMFKPMQFGRDVWIVPTAFTPPKPDAVNIMLNPGLAFGSGTHPTTALCLTWLDTHRPQGTVLDYGAGSGILAITAKKLGAEHVVATDIDPQAVSSARDNAMANQTLIDVYPVETLPSIHADVVLANILAGTLIELTDIVQGYLKPGATLVLSGILSRQAEQVIEAYPDLTLDSVTEQEGWVMIEMHKRH